MDRKTLLKDLIFIIATVAIGKEQISLEKLDLLKNHIKQAENQFYDIIISKDYNERFCYKRYKEQEKEKNREGFFGYTQNYQILDTSSSVISLPLFKI